MTADDLEVYLCALGYTLDRATDRDGAEYTVVLGVEIPRGGLSGVRCDVAIQRTDVQPYVMAAAIHTRPALVGMDDSNPVRTMASPLGSDWQYWSRRYDHPPTPKMIWAHVLTVLGDDRWVVA